jgi:tetratricopeptide (TPR) repeat protein
MNSRPVSRVILLPLAFLVSLPAVHSRGQEATIKEGFQKFRTYPFSDPDPVPRIGNIYPYFRFQGYTNVPEEREWRIVTLENPYIRVLIAPEIGGKVLGATEKSTGRDFIYYNRVVKFRDVAMRGAWTSGGIEFNFGDLGHAPTTATPVDYVTRRNPDGSVSCVVGALDLPSRTEWRVEIRLPPDRALFETRSFWLNPTELSTSLYHWMNAAATADSTLQLLYPGTAYIGHDGKRSPWPIDHQGRDLSYYRNNAFGSYKSYHVLGTYTNFFGARWGDFGVIHWSPYTDKPGKKVWIWGLSREGEIWVDLLTDTDLGNGQYIEFQSGIHFNQAIFESSRTPFKHMQFLPHSSERFTEAWFPFVGLGGVTRATPELVLEARVSEGRLHFGICPTGTLRQEISVFVRGTPIFSRQVSLAPLQAFRDSVALEAARADYEIRVGTLMHYRSTEESQRELQRPMESPASFDRVSAYGHSVDARERERQRDYEGALAAYRSSLEKDPHFLPSLCGAAELLYRRMEYETARELTLRALAVDAYDPQANYVYGLSQRKLNRPYDAKDGFGIATRSRTYRPAALLQLAEMAFRDGSAGEAAQLAERALQEDSYSGSARRLPAVLARRAGDTTTALGMLHALLAIDPLSHFARFEQFRLSGSAESRAAFTQSIRNELPHETYLELASYYLRLGMADDAALLLSLAPDQPMVNLWRAYLAGALGRDTESSQLLERGLSADPTLVFPHRQESFEILRWAGEKSPGWKTDYYLALLFLSLGRRDEASQLFERAGDAPDFAPFYLARASLRKQPPGRALADHKKAIRLAPAEWRPYTAAVNFLNAQNLFAEALGVSSDAARRFPGNSGVLFSHARTLLLNGDYGRSLRFLDSITVLPAEGARDGREVYRQANILSALEKIRLKDYGAALLFIGRARIWPEHLGAGRPYDPDMRLEDFLEAVVRKNQGDDAGARKFLDDVAEFTQRDREQLNPLHVLGAIALRALGRREEAEALVRTWITRGPSSSVAQWSLLRFRDDTEKAAQLENRLRDSVLHRATGDQEFVLVVDVVSMRLLE